LPQAEIGWDVFFGFAGLLGCGSQFDLACAKCRADRIAALIGAESSSPDRLGESGAADRCAESVRGKNSLVIRKNAGDGPAGQSSVARLELDPGLPIQHRAAFVFEQSRQHGESLLRYYAVQFMPGIAVCLNEREGMAVGRHQSQPAVFSDLQLRAMERIVGTFRTCGEERRLNQIPEIGR